MYYVPRIWHDKIPIYFNAPSTTTTTTAAASRSGAFVDARHVNNLAKPFVSTALHDTARRTADDHLAGINIDVMILRVDLSICCALSVLVCVGVIFKNLPLGGNGCTPVPQI